VTWNAAVHPRNPKGPAGGEFAGGKGGAAKAKPTKPVAKPAARKHHAASAGHGSMSFNGKTGTGYGSPHGDPRVKRLQTTLNRLHMTDAHGKALLVDGKLGPKTTAAVKKWQKAHGMKANGVVTAAMLKQATGRVHKKATLATKKRPLKAAKPKAAASRARPKGGLSLDSRTAISQSIARGR